MGASATARLPAVILPLAVVLLILSVAAAHVTGAVAEESGLVVLSEAPGRPRSAGPGSAPPSCRGRCDGCAPCRPVHVSVQPGRSCSPLEYYPEAWRCKCGNKLFMP